MVHFIRLKLWSERRHLSALNIKQISLQRKNVIKEGRRGFCQRSVHNQLWKRPWCHLMTTLHLLSPSIHSLFSISLSSLAALKANIFWAAAPSSRWEFCIPSCVFSHPLLPCWMSWIKVDLWGGKKHNNKYISVKNKHLLAVTEKCPVSLVLFLTVSAIASITAAFYWVDLSRLISTL